MMIAASKQASKQQGRRDMKAVQQEFYLKERKGCYL
jgi:hypothetical protein